MNHAPKMADFLRDNVIRAVEELAAHLGIAKTHIVRAISGHPSDWARIKKGDTPITTSLYDRVMGGVSALWPETAPWPDGIPRPVPEPGAIKRPEYLELVLASASDDADEDDDKTQQAA